MTADILGKIQQAFRPGQPGGMHPAGAAEYFRLFLKSPHPFQNRGITEVHGLIQRRTGLQIAAVKTALSAA